MGRLLGILRRFEGVVGEVRTAILTT